MPPLDDLLNGPTIQINLMGIVIRGKLVSVSSDSIAHVRCKRPNGQYSDFYFPLSKIYSDGHIYQPGQN